ncbi:unnamed protein product [Lampetra fluviatilis]
MRTHAQKRTRFTRRPGPCGRPSLHDAREGFVRNPDDEGPTPSLWVCRRRVPAAHPHHPTTATHVRRGVGPSVRPGGRMATAPIAASAGGVVVVVAAPGRRVPAPGEERGGGGRYDASSSSSGGTAREAMTVRSPPRWGARGACPRRAVPVWCAGDAPSATPSAVGGGGRVEEENIAVPHVSPHDAVVESTRS